MCLLAIKDSWCVRQSGSHWRELGGREQLCTEIILRQTPDVISTWIISVQWHASAPLDFPLVWGRSPCIWPKLDICQMPVLNSETLFFPLPLFLLSKVDTVTSALACSHSVHLLICAASLDKVTSKQRSLLGCPWQRFIDTSAFTTQPIQTEACNKMLQPTCPSSSFVLTVNNQSDIEGFIWRKKTTKKKDL